MYLNVWIKGYICDYEYICVHVCEIVSICAYTNMWICLCMFECENIMSVRTYGVRVSVWHRMSEQVWVQDMWMKVSMILYECEGICVRVWDMWVKVCVWRRHVIMCEGVWVYKWRCVQACEWSCVSVWARTWVCDWVSTVRTWVRVCLSEWQTICEDVKNSHINPSILVMARSWPCLWVSEDRDSPTPTLPQDRHHVPWRPSRIVAFACQRPPQKSAALVQHRVFVQNNQQEIASPLLCAEITSKLPALGRGWSALCKYFCKDFINANIMFVFCLNANSICLCTVEAATLYFVLSGSSVFQLQFRLRHRFSEPESRQLRHVGAGGLFLPHKGKTNPRTNSRTCSEESDFVWEFFLLKESGENENSSSLCSLCGESTDVRREMGGS